MMTLPEWGHQAPPTATRPKRFRPLLLLARRGCQHIRWTESRRDDAQPGREKLLAAGDRGHGGFRVDPVAVQRGDPVGDRACNRVQAALPPYPARDRREAECRR